MAPPHSSVRFLDTWWSYTASRLYLISIHSHKYLQKCCMQCIFTRFFILRNPQSLHCCLVTSSPTMRSRTAASVAGVTRHNCSTFWGLGGGGSSDSLIICTVHSPIDCSLTGGRAPCLAVPPRSSPVPAPADNPSTIASGVAPSVAWSCEADWCGLFFFLGIRVDLIIFFLLSSNHLVSNFLSGW